MAVPALISQYGAEYTEGLRQGRVFFGTNAVAGLALITTATTGGHPTLWNPAGSEMDISIIRLELSQVDGTNAPTSLGWYKTANAGSAFGTGAPIATFTNVAPNPALCGGAGVSRAYWAPTTNTFTVAPVFFANIPLTLYTCALATAAAGVVWQIVYNGTIGIAPGNALSICSIAATTTSKMICKVVWEEHPRD